MDSPIDKRGKLNDEVFTYKITQNKKVFISWHGKQVTILSGNKADEFAAEIENAEGKERQLIMAKATGHFKHGNENKHKLR